MKQPVILDAPREIFLLVLTGHSQHGVGGLYPWGTEGDDTGGGLKNTDPFDPDPYNAMTWAPLVARHIQVIYPSSC